MAFENGKRGVKGATVQEVRQRLNEPCYSVGAADGDFGRKSEAAVKGFQQDHGLEATGAADEATWSTLFAAAPPGAEAKADQAGGIALPEYEPVADAVRLTELMDPIMKYVDPAADGVNGIDGAACVNMDCGAEIMRWYHLHLDGGIKAILRLWRLMC